MVLVVDGVGLICSLDACSSCLDLIDDFIGLSINILIVSRCLLLLLLLLVRDGVVELGFRLHSWCWLLLDWGYFLLCDFFRH